jgi:hypothetical protein
MTAAMYTGAPAPIRKWWVIPFKYRRIRATGKSTPAFADFDMGFFFFAPLADILLFFVLSAKFKYQLFC